MVFLVAFVLSACVGSLLDFAGTMDRFVHYGIASIGDLRNSGDVHVEFVANAEVHF